MARRREQIAQTSDVSADLWDDGYGDVARRLLSASVSCFAATGFYATTTRDITSAAGLSSAALYVHFASKEAVLFEIIRSAHVDSLRVSAETEVVDDPSDQFRNLVRRFVAWHARYHVAARVSQYELAALTPEHFEVIADLRRRTTAIFHETITRGHREGAFEVVDERRVTRAVLSLGVDLVRWYRDDGPDSPTDLGEFYGDLALGMVRAAGPSTRAPRDL